MAERMAPHALDAEKSILGAALVRSDALGDVVDTLKASDFYRAAHGTIYGAMQALWRAGVSIDLLTVKNELDRLGDLDRVGGPAYIAGLVDGVPRSTNIGDYAAIVTEKARLRELAALGQRLTKRALEEDDSVDTLIEAAEREIRDTAQRTVKGWFVGGQELSQRIYADLERWQASHGITGLTTGFPDLDDYTTGLQPGDLVLIAARPSMGKTALALQIAHHVGTSLQRPVAVFSLEMGVESLGIRMACSAARVAMFRAKKGWLDRDETARITSALMPIEEGQLYLDDAMTVRVADIRRKTRQLQAKHGLALIVIDYIQLLDPPEGQRRSNRNEDLSAISRGLKKLGKELMVPVVALSQLNRALESRPDKRPRMSDLRDSGALEQDADLVLFLYRDHVYNPDPVNETAAELIIAKQRNGPLATVPLYWHPHFTRFDSVEPHLEGIAS